MGTAFTEQEKANIREKLLQQAQECLAKYGMRKTSVEQLARGAGISKGAFYSFYKTKEHLYFALLERWQEEMYAIAEQSMQKASGLPNAQRAAQILLDIIRMMDKSYMADFMADDMPYLLRKLPHGVLENHFELDDISIARFAQTVGIELKCDTQLAAATIRALILMLRQKHTIGEEHFESVAEILIRGACEQLVA